MIVRQMRAIFSVIGLSVLILLMFTSALTASDQADNKDIQKAD
jgi:hypothetical protein